MYETTIFSHNMFKIIRVTVLLVILSSVIGTYYMQRDVAMDWRGSINIKVIPVLSDDLSSTEQFVNSLTEKNFKEVESYLIQNAKNHKRDIEYAITLTLENPIHSIPPTVPQAGSSFLTQSLWALKLKWWAWNNQPKGYRNTDIRLYMLYQSPDKNVKLSHSTGIRNGLIGLINARALTRNKRFHNVILTHELLHIVGATDKYDLSSGQPLFPQGYYQANAKPLWPQQYAEIMGRAIPLSDNEFEVAERLSRTRIGEITAREIGWIN